jgi:hypothetical protein
VMFWWPPMANIQPRFLKISQWVEKLMWNTHTHEHREGIVISCLLSWRNESRLKIQFVLHKICNRFCIIRHSWLVLLGK